MPRLHFPSLQAALTFLGSLLSIETSKRSLVSRRPSFCQSICCMIVSMAFSLAIVLPGADGHRTEGVGGFDLRFHMAFHLSSSRSLLCGEEVWGPLSLHRLSHRLNNITVKDHYSLPLMTSVFEILQQTSVYNLIWVREGNESNTAFNHYVFSI